MKLAFLELPLQRQSGPLVPQILAALSAHGQPLRWAITAVRQESQGAILQIEAVMLQGSGPRPQAASPP